MNDTVNPARLGAALTMLALLTFLIAPLAVAQNVSDAEGKVVDAEGNPIQGATVTFIPQGNPTLKYDATTNKKGKYFVAGLFTPKEDDRWDVTFEAEGFLPVSFSAESRTANRVLVDELTAKLGPGQSMPDMIIRPLGTLHLDFTVGPESDVLAASRPAVEQEGGLEPVGVEAPAKPAEPQRDVWSEALSLAGTGDLEAAAPLLAKAVEEAPEDAERHEVRAKVLFQLEEMDEAIEAAERAIELDPKRIDAYMLQYQAYEYNDDLGAGIEVLRRALAVAPDDARVLRRLAHGSGRLGNQAEAIEIYQSITDIAPQDAEAWLALGNLYAEADRLDESQAAFQRVVDLDPDQAHQTYYNLGVLLLGRGGSGDAERAAQAFRKATEIKGDYGPAYRQLGTALLNLGDTKGAQAALESYLRVAPQAQDADQMRQLIATLESR